MAGYWQPTKQNLKNNASVKKTCPFTIFQYRLGELKNLLISMFHFLRSIKTYNSSQTALNVFSFAKVWSNGSIEKIVYFFIIYFIYWIEFALESSFFQEVICTLGI